MPTKSRRNGNGHSNGNGRNGRRHRPQQPLKNQPQDAAPKTVDDEMLRTLALELRRDGASYRSIAAAMTSELQKQGVVRVISKDIAHRLVVEGLTELRSQNSETAEQVRQLELERLDVWLARLNTSKDRGTPRVIDTMLRIQERRAKLLDLDLATTKIVGGDDPIKMQWVDARNQLREKLDHLKRTTSKPASDAPAVSQNAGSDPSSAASSAPVVPPTQ